MKDQNHTKSTRREFLIKSAMAGAVLSSGSAFGNTVSPPEKPAEVNKMKITKIEAIFLSKPMKNRYWTARSAIGGFDPHATRIIVYVYTNQGIVGIGEGRDGGASVLKKGFGDLLIGENPFEVEYLWQNMFSKTLGRERVERGWSSKGLPIAIAALDAALWDIRAKAVGLPLYRLLGGRNDPVDCYVTGFYYQDGIGPKDIVKEAEQHLKIGYKALKIKVGGVSIDEDVERVELIRKTVGGDIRLMVDVNKGWSLRQAIEGAKKLYPFNIEWLEEPLHWYDEVGGLVRLKKDCPIPIASGENVTNRYGARRLLETGTIDFMQFDCHENLGITEWLKIAGMASTYDVWMAPHHEPQLHGHLLASVPNGYILETFGNSDRDPWWFELYTRKPEIVDSKLTLLDEPGIGVEFDELTIKRYGTKIV